MNVTVAARRASQSLPPLQMFVIDVIAYDSSSLNPEDAEMLKQTKMSSTFIREWISANKKERLNEVMT
jgi:pantetheine-phosphate adenylyltransferase